MSGWTSVLTTARKGGGYSPVKHGRHHKAFAAVVQPMGCVRGNVLKNLNRRLVQVQPPP